MKNYTTLVPNFLKKASCSGKSFANEIERLRKKNQLKEILPEIDRMQNFPHSLKHHPEGGVYDHTLICIKENKKPDIAINLSILFHDIGKIMTHKIIDGIHKYPNHDEAGTKLISSIAKRLGLNADIKKIIIFCIKNHTKMG